MFRVLVADPISEEGLQPLLESPLVSLTIKKVDEVKQELHEFDAILVRSATHVSELLIKKMKKLKIIARAGVGVDNIDIDAATKYGVVVINAPNGNTISTAEHTFAMMASLMRHIPQASQSVKQGEWKRSSFVGAELYQKRLGIIGFGRIGGEISKRAKAFGMEVIVFDPFLNKSKAEKFGVQYASLHELLEQSDIITVHTPLTKETKHLINNKTVQLTKQGVYFINCARGGIIDEGMLIEFLENGHIGGVALDVFEVEPPVNHKLIAHNKVITTPHLGASTKEAQLNVASQVAEEVLAFLKGHPVTSSINLPTLSKEVYRAIKPYYHLAKKIGSFISQCMQEPVQEISISYEGSVTELETPFITKSLLASFLNERIDFTVNEVNAGIVATERGISYSEKKQSNLSGYENCLTVEVKGEQHYFTVKATSIPNFGERIVKVNDFNIDFYPNGPILYVQHLDKPGVIGHVGNILGNYDVNIATMQVGRKKAGGEAIMMLTFDKQVDVAVINELKELQDILSIIEIFV
ncbi:phosphoglycerate dehydrogenase [Bacillus carboniphilus]|uniref:D-3-phosphoglycerate dehydrogenase n=1 Tax=Bacillus carboniphilus TaxID=86663 RepID=A0ABY9K1H9_9BACI|nr:phosphoglycerate dehydrogenase [Bacillus carboniphilus]WLR43771.1 phosphoglycerate dehydrogenase [Bacillus carboniphilus]